MEIKSKSCFTVDVKVVIIVIKQSQDILEHRLNVYPILQEKLQRKSQF